MIVVISLTLLLSVSLPHISDINASPGRGGGIGGVGASVGGNSIGGVGGGVGGSIGGGPAGVGPGNQPSSGLNPPTNCLGSGGLFPSGTNCGSPTVSHPNNAPNAAVVQNSNCNVPTSAHTNTPNNIVVHPATTNCATANTNVVNPNSVPNAAVVQPTNCNTPTSVHRTNAPSTVVVHPSNCPPPTSVSSNSLTVNNVQSSSGTTTTTTTTPVANAGSNQNVRSSDKVTLDGSKSYDPEGHSITYSWQEIAGGPVVLLSNDDKAKPTFTAPLVTDPANLRFQLIVNNGNANSNPSYVSVTVTP